MQISCHTTRLTGESRFVECYDATSNCLVGNRSHHVTVTLSIPDVAE